MRPGLHRDLLNTLCRFVTLATGTMGGKGETFRIVMRCGPCKREHPHAVPWPNQHDLIVEAIQLLERARWLKRNRKHGYRFIWTGHDATPVNFKRRKAV